MKFTFSNIIDRVKEILLNPKTFWITNKDEEENQSQLFTGYLIPFLISVSLAVFLGEFFRSTHFYMGFAVLKAVREMVLFLLQYFIAVYFTNELMKTFGANKNIEISRRLVAYSLTPLFLVSIVTGLFPFLYALDVLGIYSFYIFWIGGKELLVFPDQKRDSYLIITIVVNFFVFSFLSILLSKLLTAYY